jgi:hypothetical protein
MMYGIHRVQPEALICAEVADDVPAYEDAISGSMAEERLPNVATAALLYEETIHLTVTVLQILNANFGIARAISLSGPPCRKGQSQLGKNAWEKKTMRSGLTSQLLVHYPKLLIKLVPRPCSAA